MARRKRHGRKGKGSIAVAPLVPVALVVVDAYHKGGGFTAGSANALIENLTGYNAMAKQFSAAAAMPFWLGEIAGIVVHKVANKTPVNRVIRKATFGYLSI